MDSKGARADELWDSRFTRSLLAASGDRIKVIDLDGKLSFMSETAVLIPRRKSSRWPPSCD